MHNRQVIHSQLKEKMVCMCTCTNNLISAKTKRYLDNITPDMDLSILQGTCENEKIHFVAVFLNNK